MSGALVVCHAGTVATSTSVAMTAGTGATTAVTVQAIAMGQAVFFAVSGLWCP